MTQELKHFTKVKELLEDKKFPTTNDLLLVFTELSSYIDSLLTNIAELNAALELKEADREVLIKHLVQRQELHHALLRTFQTAFVESKVIRAEQLEEIFKGIVIEMKQKAEEAAKLVEKQAEELPNSESIASK